MGRGRSLPAAAAIACAAASPLAACLLSIDDGAVDRDASGPDATAGGDVTAPPLDASEAGAPAEAGTGTEAQAHVEAGTEAGPVEAASGCPASMIQVPAPGGGKAYCIDATEVTNEQYGAFLGVADAGAQIAVCSWNADFQPLGGIGSNGQAAVGALDWCDAYAYCAWAGKRLCGAIGGGSLPYASWPTTSSQWFNACSHGGTLAYPYGNQYEPTWCNGAPTGNLQPVAVGSYPQCEGGYPGLFDMSGNVSEFIDSCGTTPEPACGSGGDDCDLCLLVGGGFLSGADGGSNIACAYPNQIYRRAKYVDNGFRCCMDLP